MAFKVFLKFRDERGAERRVEVNGSPFFIGRLPECDLPINSINLSRKHAKIECFGEIAVISDCGSSNGTSLNGSDLTEPLALKNSDEIVLGGDIHIKVEIEGARNYATDYPEPNYQSNISAPQNTETASTSFFASPFVLAPVAGFLVLGLVGGLLFAFAPRQNPKEDVVKVINQEDDKPILKNKNSREEDLPKPTPTSSPISSTGSTPSNPTSSPTPVQTDSPTSTPPPVSREMDKVETNAYKFLNKISFDSNAFLSSAQVREISGQINKLKSSGALRENLRTAKRNVGQIQSLAQANGLKPTLLMATALARMGERRDTVISDANSIVPGLRGCADILGTDGIADALLVIAAFADGNSPKELQGKIGAMTKESGVSSSDARSVWFLQERGKISKDSFDFVMRVIAIGAISQNPRDFGIDADPVS